MAKVDSKCDSATVAKVDSDSECDSAAMATVDPCPNNTRPWHKTTTTVAPTPPDTDGPPTPPITEPTTPPPSFSSPGQPRSTPPGRVPSPSPPPSPSDPTQPSPANPGTKSPETTRTNRSPQPTLNDNPATQPPGGVDQAEQSTPLASTQFPLTTSALKPPFVLPGAGPSPSSAVPTTTKAFTNLYDSPFARFDPNRRVTTRQDSFMTAFIGLCTVCLIVAVVVRLLNRARPSSKPPTSINSHYQASQNSTTSASEPQINWRNLADIQLDMGAIELSKPLAAGSYGVVWRATLHPNVVVAVKTCTRTSLDDVQNFVDELALLSTLHNPYLVTLVGVAWTKASDLMAVLEFMDSGDLCEKLAATKDTAGSFPWRHKLECALSIAHALVYLKTQHVIHRDLKSRNVLLDSTRGTKLADFGISKHHDDTHASMTTGVGTYRWMAPEVLTFRRYTISVDVYSFGVLLTELDTHRVPFTDVQNDHGHNIADAAVVCMVLYENLRPTFSEHCPPWYVDLGRRCMHADAAERPPPEEIVEILSRELFNVAVDVPSDARRHATGS